MRLGEKIVLEEKVALTQNTSEVLRALRVPLGRDLDIKVRICMKMGYPPYGTFYKGNLYCKGPHRQV